MRWPDRLLVVAGIAALTRDADAQRLTGVVRDATLGQPVAGAVVAILAADGTAPQRTVTDRAGTFRLAVVPGARLVQVRRIGFLPRDLPVVDSARTGTATVIITLDRIPAVLDPVVSQAVGCPRGGATGEALALWDQARLGMLATVVGRDVQMVSRIITFRQREREGALVSQSIETRMATAGPPMFSERTPEEYATFGFSRMTSGGRAFYGPDAEVLMHDAFRAGHCFDLAAPDRAHPGQVGISFTPIPVPRQDTLVEMAGTLWLNRTPLALAELDFRYEAGDATWRAKRPGGTVVFHTVDNGIVVIEHWTIRVPDVTRTAVIAGARGRATFTVRPDSGVVIVGADLLSAKWPDGTTLVRSFPAVTGVVVDERGQPSAAVTVSLDHTPYHATTGADGRFTIPDVLPGPYVLSAADSEWWDFGVGASSATRFVVPPAGVVRPLRVEIPSPARTLADQCRATLNPGDPSHQDVTMVGHVVDADGRPVVTRIGVMSQGAPTPIKGTVFIDTDARGVFAVCGLFPGAARVTVRDSMARPFEQWFQLPPNGGTLKVQVVPPRGPGGAPRAW